MYEGSQRPRFTTEMGRVCWLLMQIFLMLSQLAEAQKNHQIQHFEALRTPDNKASLNVKWMAPVEANGIITNYNVSWTWEGGANHGLVNDTSNTSYTIHGLAACTNYTVTVAASTSKGYGDESVPVSRETSGHAPPSPSVTCEEVVSPYLTTVTWLPVITTCTVRGYRVNYTGDVLWSDDTRHDSQEVETTYADLSDLTPWTTYTVCVAGVVVNNVVGAWSCCSSTTLEAAPGKPANLEQTSVSSKSVTVSWVQPEELNGVLTGYQLVWDDGYTNLTASITTYTISGLQPNSPYTVSVKAGTAAGWGPTIKIQVNTDKGANVGAVVGGVVGGLVGALLMLAVVAAVVFFRRKRMGKNKSTERRSSPPDLAMAHRFPTVSSIIHKNDNQPAKGPQEELQYRKHLTHEPIALTTTRKVEKHNPYYIHEERSVAVFKENIYDNLDQDIDDPIYMSLD